MRRPRTVGRAQVRRWSARGLLALLAAGALVLCASLGNVAAYYSDSVASRTSGVAGDIGVRVTTTVAPASAWTDDVSSEIIDEIVDAVLDEYVTSALQSTARPLVEAAVEAQIGALISTMKVYTLTVEVDNTGTISEDVDLGLFDYFDNVGTTDTPEQGGVVVSTDDSPLDVAIASLVANVSIDVSITALVDISVDLSTLFPALPGTVIDDDTPDDSTIATDADGPYLGQTADVAPITLGPAGSDTSSKTLTYTVLVQAKDLVDLGIVTSADPELNLTLGATAEATGVNAGVDTGWTAQHEDWDGTLVHVDINNPPVIVATTTEDRTPFVGQIGDTAAGQPTVSAYLAGLFRATDTEDGNTAITQAITVTSDFVADVAGAYTATANVTDSGGKSADPVTQTIQEWNFTQVAAGQYFALALDSRGRAWGWGMNTYGQVDGSGSTTSPVTVPQLIQGLPSGKKVVQVAGGSQSSYFLMDDGSLYALGYNIEGELGNGKTTNSATPVAVSLSVPVTKVSAMRTAVAALGTDGSVWTWGSGELGQLGTGDVLNRSTPKEIVTSGAVDVGQGYYNGAAVLDDGTITAWGYNSVGELGAGTADGLYHTPALVAGVSNAATLSVGGFFTVYLTSAGDVWGFGNNDSNHFTAGTTGYRVPTEVTGGGWSSATQVVAGYDFTLVLAASGDVYGIGVNDFDQLLTGAPVSQSAYVKSAMVSGIGGLAAGIDTSVLLKADGSMIYTHGYGADGEMGNGTATSLTGSTIGKISLTHVYDDGTVPDVTPAATGLTLHPGSVPSLPSFATPEASEEPSPTAEPSPSATASPSADPSPRATDDELTDESPPPSAAAEPGTDAGPADTGSADTGSADADASQDDQAEADQTESDQAAAQAGGAAEEEQAQTDTEETDKQDAPTSPASLSASVAPRPEDGSEAAPVPVVPTPSS